MTEFEPRSSGIGRDHAANCATTIALKKIAKVKVQPCSGYFDGPSSNLNREEISKAVVRNILKENVCYEISPFLLSKSPTRTEDPSCTSAGHSYS